jgi:hypothetical protein
MGNATPEQLLQYAEQNDTDVISYIGQISRTGYDKICDIIPEKKRRNCLLILATFGGDPHAGYRIARALSHNYPEPGVIRVLVPTYCKSAGTLICIGANELIVADQGELGPVDVQVQKPDEILQLSSGLDIIRGLEYLQTSTLETFREILLDISQGSGLSTTISSEIATKLTTGMYEPILAQIDPLKLGEMQAALTIATEYGRRLNERTKNLRNNSLAHLSSRYPAHGFVIDRKEVKQLFERVRAPDGDVEANLCLIASRIFMKCYSSVNVANVLVEFAPAQPSEHQQDEQENPHETVDGRTAESAESEPTAPEISEPASGSIEGNRTTGQRDEATEEGSDGGNSAA